MKAYRMILRNSRFRPYFFAETLSRAGDSMHIVAWMASFYRMTQSGAALGLLMFIRFAPEVFLGPIFGVWADLFDRRRLIVFSDVLRGLSVLALVVWGGHPLTYYLATFVLAIGLCLNRPAKLGLLPQLMGKEDLLAANSLMSAGSNLARVVGAAAGGIILATAGPGLAFGLNAASYLLAGAVAWFALPSLAVIRGPVRSLWHDVADGLSHLKSNPRVLSVIAVISAMWIGVAVSDVTLIMFLQDVLLLPDSMFGYLRTVIGLGSMLGALITPRIARRQTGEYRVLLWVISLVGVLFGALALTIRFWEALLLYALGCSAATVAENLSNTVQQRVPDHVRGRIIATGATIDTLGYLVVVTVSPVLTEFVPVRVVLLLGGVLILVALPAAHLMVRLFMPEMDSEAAV